MRDRETSWLNILHHQKWSLWERERNYEKSLFIISHWMYTYAERYCLIVVSAHFDESRSVDRDFRLQSITRSAVICPLLFFMHDANHTHYNIIMCDIRSQANERPTNTSTHSEWVCVVTVLLGVYFACWNCLCGAVWMDARCIAAIAAATDIAAVAVYLISFWCTDHR